MVSNTNKNYHSFLPKSMRNSHNHKIDSQSIRYFNCNKRGHKRASCPFEDRRQKSDSLITKSSSINNESEKYQSPKF